LTHGWLFSAVLLAYLLVYRKNSGKFSENFPHSIFPEKLQPYPHLSLDLPLTVMMMMMMMMMTMMMIVCRRYGGS